MVLIFGKRLKPKMVSRANSSSYIYIYTIWDLYGIVALGFHRLLFLAVQLPPVAVRGIVFAWKLHREVWQYSEAAETTEIAAGTGTVYFFFGWWLVSECYPFLFS